MTVEQFLTGQVGIQFLLVLARVSGVFLIAPVFSSRLLTVRVRLLLALAISLLVLPIAAPQAPEVFSVVQIGVLAVKEVLVGLALAFAAALVFAAVSYAGSLIDYQAGFSFANVIDPMTSQQTAIVGQTYQLLATIVFIIIGGPEVIIGAIARSYTMVPMLESPPLDLLSQQLVAELGVLFATGLVLASPIVITLLITDTAVGFLARVAPQMNIFGVELPAKIAVTILMLAVFAPLIVTGIGETLRAGLIRTTQMLLG
jgi:flagellar biosynthesis protein FliR